MQRYEWGPKFLLLLSSHSFCEETLSDQTYHKTRFLQKKKVLHSPYWQPGPSALKPLLNPGLPPSNPLQPGPSALKSPLQPGPSAFVSVLQPL